jgi:very-short-patch-repair endonuclease
VVDGTLSAEQHRRSVLLSHDSAAALWRIRAKQPGPIDISLPRPRDARHDGIRTHRRSRLGEDEVTVTYGIPVTTPVLTIFDIAPALTESELEREINEADKLDLVHPEPLREAAAHRAGEGAAIVRKLLDKKTFLLTDSELERLFIPIAAAAELERPETRATVNGHRVDFFFRELGLVVETDGGRFHRTPFQQTADRVRDQTHTAAGLTVLRFTHAQVRYEPAYVASTLARTATALRRAAA